MPRRLTVHRLEDRLTPVGGLDPTFGTGGIITTAPAPEYGGPVVAFQPDGRILLATTGTTGDTVVTRYIADGSPDATFGVDGAADPTPGRTAFLHEMVVTPDGHIYLSGYGTSDISLAVVSRMTADGTPDATYSDDGVATLRAGMIVTSGLSMAVQPDGSAVLFGNSVGETGFGYAAIRLTPAGDADPTFGLNGRFFHPVTVPMPGVRDVTALPDGSLVMLGTLGILTPEGGGYPYSYTVTVLRLTADGTADPTFSGDGYWVAGEDGAPVLLAGVSGLIVQPDGKIVVSGRGDEAMLAVRLNPDGSTDTDFGEDGIAVAMPDTVYSGGILAGQLSDGRLVVVSGRVSTRGPAVRVLNPDGTPDDYFGDGDTIGDLVYEADGPWTFATSLNGAAVHDDRIVVTSGLLTAFYMQDAPPPKYGLAVLTEREDALSPDHFWPHPIEPFPDPTPWQPPLTVEPPQPVGEPIKIADPVPEQGSDENTGDPRLIAVPGETTVVMRRPVRRVDGDLNGDGVADRVVTAGPTVGVMSGADGTILIKSFAPFEAGYSGPLNAVLADTDGDGRAELVVSPDQGGGPVVAVYRADGTPAGRFFGIEDGNFRGGVRLAAGDVDGDGASDVVVTAGDGGGPRVAVFDGRSLGGTARRLVGDFFAFEEGQRGGAFAAFLSGQLVFGAGPGGGPRVRAVSAQELLVAAPRTLDELPAAARGVDQFVGDPASRRGAKVAVRGQEGGWYEVTADAGDGRPVSVFVGPIPEAVVPLVDDGLHGTLVG